MTDKIIAIAAMLDATDGERDNASRILQRMLASRDSTLTEFIKTGLDRIGVTQVVKDDILGDAVFPFDVERINRLTAKLNANGLSWRTVAVGRPADNKATLDYFDLTTFPYDLLFDKTGRRVVRMADDDKMVYEMKREELETNIIAMINPQERKGNVLTVKAYTQDAETIIFFGTFTITGEESIDAVMESVRLERAMMFRTKVPRNPAKPMTLEVI